MSPSHCTREELFLFVDGALSHEEQARVQAHCVECASCAAAEEAARRVGSGVRGLPPERTGAGFTASVIRELGLSHAPRGAFRGLESAGALVAMVVVGGILLSVFYATGVLTQSHVSETQTSLGVWLERGGEALADAVNAAGGWLATYLPFAFGKGVLGISIAAAAVLALLAVVDRFAGRRLIHRVD